MTAATTDDLIDRFEAGTLDPARFGHGEHVEVAFELVSRHGFIGALPRIADGVRRLAEGVGRPDVYNETITTAFTAIIAERLRRRPPSSYAAFEAANPDLFERGLLRAWYADADLRSDVARAVFVLPRPSRAGGGRATGRSG